jgi:glycosyltransferase involved in cell wall biosynthesis
MKKVEESMLVPAVVEARVIPNGVDLSIFQPADKLAARAGLNLPQKAKVLLTTGIMIHKNIWKDYSTLRHAITLVKDEFSEQDLLLIVLGEDAPPERTDGLEVRYIPYEKDPRVVARYYQAADIYVHAVRADTFPTSVIEAMACGKPVVATAIGGIPEQIEDTYTGFLVPKGDAPGLAARVTQILSDDRLKVDIGMQAAKSARYRFGFDRQVEAYLSWYDELLRGRTGMISTGKSYALSNPG